jgi:hypothetical protein
MAVLLNGTNQRLQFLMSLISQLLDYNHNSRFAASVRYPSLLFLHRFKLPIFSCIRCYLLIRHCKNGCLIPSCSRRCGHPAQYLYEEHLLAFDNIAKIYTICAPTMATRSSSSSNQNPTEWEKHHLHRAKRMEWGNRATLECSGDGRLCVKPLKAKNTDELSRG